ncbi:hypothetical protein [Phytohabitans aurantiacus]|uniref:DUF1772 domain-containing protein n=1 Tax=Phytohabitans aurantiacus TaxID=3016789 RepID=A0ABQ5QUS7_9ACTN|nr:hypothetical protein [Phytohabitans aurantiacus]GLH97095.1 hypothetical protein Pa4123_23690 [Phytohabitans aurantiacus]
MTIMRYAPTACVCVGLVAAIVYRRRLGQAAWLAISAFAVLVTTFAGSILWSEHIERMDANPPDFARLEEILVQRELLHWASGAGTVAGFLLLLAAVLAGRTATPVGAGEQRP